MATNKYASTTPLLQPSTQTLRNPGYLISAVLEPISQEQFIALRFIGDNDVRKGYHLELGYTVSQSTNTINAKKTLNVMEISGIARKSPSGP